MVVCQSLNKLFKSIPRTKEQQNIIIDVEYHNSFNFKFAIRYI